MFLWLCVRLQILIWNKGKQTSRKTNMQQETEPATLSGSWQWIIRTVYMSVHMDSYKIYDITALPLLIYAQSVWWWSPTMMKSLSALAAFGRKTQWMNSCSIRQSACWWAQPIGPDSSEVETSNQTGQAERQIRGVYYEETSTKPKTLVLPSYEE